MERIKPYSVEQFTRLSQFKRARGLLNILNQQETEIAKGNKVMATDKIIQEVHFFDYWEVRILRGALYGMYNEAVSLGLKEEIK